MAIAASVALMAIITVGPGMPGLQQTTGELAGESEIQPFTSPQSLTSPPSSSQANFTGAGNSSDRAMDSYLLRHYQAAGASGGKGFVTYVPIVVIGVKPEEEMENIPSDEETEAGTAEESR